MRYCPTCQREVVVFGVSSFPGADRIAEDARVAAEAEGKLILFNPPPIGPYRCPRCLGELVEDGA